MVITVSHDQKEFVAFWTAEPHGTTGHAATHREAILALLDNEARRMAGMTETCEECHKMFPGRLMTTFMHRNVCAICVSEMADCVDTGSRAA